MAISDWPADERPREKLLARGATSLSDAELLAIFLRTGVAGCSAVDLARELLTGFGSLRALLRADRGSFCSKKGLGAAKFAQLQAVLEMARRYQEEILFRENALTSPAHTRAYLQIHLRDRSSECFCCLFLDNRHRPLAFEELFQGTIDGAAVYPREVVKRALTHNAAALVLAHNHPSGIAEPSDADIRLTRRLSDALALVDVRVLDHMVVGDGMTVSLAERGLM
ncbi:DNA repair protein RadC [Sansalvadorimonas sp. 2012CJ34-2]|uniref:DNA repair protein RadC n=1 Tax=Parendozoicomonas callyspongiae TaxID=2942213 RepID=A0ABT0PEB1_9GAMM|nr:DNA repair protein RadC [Sansalvadorimonas sp. 2012CJ34-2]MCL6269717.1 DNA repair protein RadC [Sansalvadorimonas sp. 2012CJ34-2]